MAGLRHRQILMDGIRLKFMAELIKKHQGWLLPLVFNLVIGSVIYLHSMSVKAAIVEELKDYVPRDELTLRENAHGAWASEAAKRIDGKMDDMIRRLERIENRPAPQPVFQR